MKENIINALKELRNYALKKGYIAEFIYHEEDSYLIRFANSSISLNTNEHLIRLDIILHEDRKRVNYAMITNLSNLEEIKNRIDKTADLLPHARPLYYQPTLPFFKETFIDETGYDHKLACLTNQEKLDYVNIAVNGLETSNLKLSGIFANGMFTMAQICTNSENVQYFKTSDAQISLAMAHSQLKWEVGAEQSAQKKEDLNPSELHKKLQFLISQYSQQKSVQLPIGKYDIVFGQGAIAWLTVLLNWMGYSGGGQKRGFSFLSNESIGKKIFSDKFTLVDDTSYIETFPFKRDITGIERTRFPLFVNGVFQNFMWFQDDADEFKEKATGHTAYHHSIVLQGGDISVSDFNDLISMKRENDILFIPYLHYMNIVNPSIGTFTGSSRFGALFLKKDGSIEIPYNVRITQNITNIFGDNIKWISQQKMAYNLTQSYGARNPIATVVPLFMYVKDLEISQSNSSF